MKYKNYLAIEDEINFMIVNVIIIGNLNYYMKNIIILNH